MGYRSWYTKVLGIGRLYDINVESYDYTNAAKHAIKSIITQKYICDWRNKLRDLVNNPILRTYSTFKDNFECGWHSLFSRKLIEESLSIPDISMMPFS